MFQLASSLNIAREHFLRLMPAFIAYLRRKLRVSSAPLHSQNLSSETGCEGVPACNKSPYIDRKIHPDLDSLIAEQDYSAYTRHSPDYNALEDNKQNTTTPATLGLAPLSPSTRRNPSNLPIFFIGDLDRGHSSTGPGLPKCELLPDVPSSNAEGSQEPVRKPEQSFSTSSVSISTSQNTSSGTFGQRVHSKTSRPRVHGQSPTTPITPGSGSSHYPSQVSIIDSRLNSPYQGYGFSRASSHNTFGVPSPSSRFTFGSHRKPDESTRILPPMPPLNHPAFLSKINPDDSQTKHTSPRSLVEDESIQMLKVARHTQSLLYYIAIEYR